MWVIEECHELVILPLSGSFLHILSILGSYSFPIYYVCIAVGKSYLLAEPFGTLLNLFEKDTI